MTQPNNKPEAANADASAKPQMDSAALEQEADALLAEALGSTTAEPDPLTVALGERDDMRDKLLRLMAEMENLRRRTEKEMADAKAYAVTAFARDMLGVSDNLRRATESVPEATKGSAPSEAQAQAFADLLTGVDLTERDMLKVLERHGVKRLEPEGQKFDPNLHQAMFEAPDANVPKGMVVQVMQAGFTIAGRVLRPALVGVSSGAPKADPAPEV
ncbi:MAG: nucleotide exchange factor GrpE [Bosea sp. (in: a-proteobacteria)]